MMKLQFSELFCIFSFRFVSKHKNSTKQTANYKSHQIAEGEREGKKPIIFPWENAFAWLMNYDSLSTNTQIINSFHQRWMADGFYVFIAFCRFFTLLKNISSRGRWYLVSFLIYLSLSETQAFIIYSINIFSIHAGQSRSKAKIETKYTTICLYPRPSSVYWTQNQTSTRNQFYFNKIHTSCVNGEQERNVWMRLKNCRKIDKIPLVFRKDIWRMWTTTPRDWLRFSANLL